ncbi:CoA-disulfide reductase [Priestia taiwanensis]|uniref:CoA-disulfide reductase n=1 Tax=Priestia taiwanensis TaxID=1347902 RepID=A0A917AVZ2_9BACI|nr:CoA-disulfide reductase [Priestia taiwanensis]MBM7364707.1 CoA-disulfide reductase [Priestia taiwanensis]GGE79015.1 CoA-disulfide reductase [Priestia taiwanensis]
MKIVIIGGVAAGMSAAAKAKRMMRDAEVVVYERTDVVSFGACGLPYFVGDFFSDPNEMVARTAEKFRETGINVRDKHEVLSVDTKAKTLRVRSLETNEEFEDTYERLMIATGASAVIPPIENVRLQNVFTLKSMEDGLQLKEAAMKEEMKDVIVIGAGYIGIEVVEAMKKLGKEVRLVQLGDRVLPDSFDHEVTDIMEAELREHGVHLHLQEAVKAFKGTEKVEEVVTDKGTYKADIVVIATGVRPNTSFLQESGIEMLRNGAIKIDEYGKTSLTDIYAAGDCASVYHLVRDEHVYIPLATTANKIGRIVGENLAGATNTFPGTLGSACVKVMDVEAGRTGISEEEAKKLELNYRTTVIRDKNQTSYYPGQEDILVKLVYDAETKVIFGGQIVGKQGAVLRVDVLAAAIAKKMTTEELGMLDLCYAPPFARTWDVLNVAGNVSK